jgi:spermidine synthase
MPLDTRRAAALAFLTAAAALFCQVLVHRVVSAKLLNNYAFVVISLTMLGFAVSGAVLARFARRLYSAPEETVASCLALFSLTLLLCTVAFYHAPAGAQAAASRGAFIGAALIWMPIALLFAIPFAFCGLILGMLLSWTGLSTRRIYFFDLAGSAAGALAVVPAIRFAGVEKALVACAAAVVIGAVLLVPPRRSLGRGLLAASALLVAVTALAPGRAFAMRYPQYSMLSWINRVGPEYGTEYTAWDPVAHIEVSRIAPPVPEDHSFPALIGRNPAFLARFQRLLTQNNWAFTYAVHYEDRESLRGIEETLYAAAYQAGAVPNPKVLVVGVGGGFDVLTGLFFEASDVTGLEVNQATVDVLTRIYPDYFGRWVTDPRVHVREGEGRNYLARTGETYDVLQLSGVDSYSGTPGAAHVFSESYLYTDEAFDLYLSRLSPNGIVNLMRLEFRVLPREMMKALVTAVAALRRAGVAQPRDHIVTLTANNLGFTALLVKKSPFTSAELDRLHAWAAASPFFHVSASPRTSGGRDNAYQLFLAQADPRRERSFVESYPMDIRPATDDRPFFFNYSYWSHLVSRDPLIVQNSVPAREYSVILLALFMGGAAVACVTLPLRYLARHGLPVPQRRRWAFYFAAIAVGYLALEVALMQKFALFLGHPNYALPVVLGSLLFATGLGSLASRWFTESFGGVRFVAYALAAVVFAEYFAAFPQLPRLVGLPFGWRAALVAALVAPIGICLGVFLPSGLDRLKQGAPELAAWAWGVNGVFSVLAPVAAVAFSITWGIDALLLSAVPTYLAASLAVPPREQA